MANKNLEMCQKNAEEVTVLMKDNVEKVLERDGKLKNLEDRSKELENMACNFQKTAKAVELKTRWEKWRWYIIIGGIILVIVIIIIAILVTQLGGGQGAQAAAEKP